MDGQKIIWRNTFIVMYLDKQIEKWTDKEIDRQINRYMESLEIIYILNSWMEEQLNYSIE